MTSVTTPALRPSQKLAYFVEEALAPPASFDSEAQSRSHSSQDFSAVCETHLDQVWRQLRAMGVAERHLDDATQEVFLTAHRKYQSFEHRAKIGTWLYAIAYRVGCNYRRRAQRDPLAASTEFEQAEVGPDPEQTLATKQMAQFVQRFCESLSEKLRDVFVLCLLEGQPATEVAALLEVPENTIYSRVRLVRDAFGKELARWKEHTK
jgi:RNA polymerase sigma-70 factor (ECF subfamily)